MMHASRYIFATQRHATVTNMKVVFKIVVAQLGMTYDDAQLCCVCTSSDYIIHVLLSVILR